MGGTIPLLIVASGMAVVGNWSRGNIITTPKIIIGICAVTLFVGFLDNFIPEIALALAWLVFVASALTNAVPILKKVGLTS